MLVPRRLRTSIRTIEWFILCHRRCIAHNLISRPQAKLAGHLRILPTEPLSTSIFRQPKYFSSVDPVCFGQTTCIFSPKICYLGELTLVLELDCQSLWGLGGNVVSELGGSIHIDLSVAMGHTSQTSADACTLFQDKSRAVPHYLGNRLRSQLSPSFCPPLHCRQPHLSLQYQSCCLLCSGLVGLLDDTILCSSNFGRI